MEMSAMFGGNDHIAPRLQRCDSARRASAEDLERLLATTEGDRPEDLRDRALLLTLCVYGLRAGEARGLRLDDIGTEVA